MKWKEIRAWVMTFSTTVCRADGTPWSDGRPTTPKEFYERIKNYRSISKAEFICHNQDVIQESDMEKYRQIYANDFKNQHQGKDYIQKELLAYVMEQESLHPERAVGNPKPDHIHGVLITKNCYNKLSVEVVAGWLGIPANLIEACTGHNADLEAVKYLTHEDPMQYEVLHKHRYEDTELVGNFDHRAFVNQRTAEIEKHGGNNSRAEAIMKDVAYKGKTLSEVRAEYPDIWVKYMKKMEEARKDYLANLPLPKFRCSIYIGASGAGIGKTMFANIFCMEVLGVENIAQGEFVVTKDVRFNGYDGQLSLLWDDFRPEDVISFWNGRSEAYKSFEPHPESNSGTRRVLYGKTNVINTINIFTAPMKPLDWLDGFAGKFMPSEPTQIESEEIRKDQVYRRIPLAIYLTEQGYYIYRNKGVFDGSGEWEKWEKGNLVSGNLRDWVHAFGRDSEYFAQLSKNFVAPLVEAHKDLVKRETSGKLSDDEKKAFFDKEVQKAGKFANESVPSVSEEVVTTSDYEDLEAENVTLRRQKEYFQSMWESARNILTDEQKRELEEFD